MKFVKKAFTAVRNQVPAIVVGVTTMGVTFAARADEVTDAITEASTKATTYITAGGTAQVAVALAAVGFGIGVKIVKRLRGAA